MSLLFVCILVEGTTSSRVLFSGFVLLKIWPQKIPNFSKISQRKTKNSPFFVKRMTNFAGKKTVTDCKFQPSINVDCNSITSGWAISNLLWVWKKKPPFNLLALLGQSKPAPSRTQLLMVCEQGTLFHGIPVPHWLPYVRTTHMHLPSSHQVPYLLT